MPVFKRHLSIKRRIFSQKNNKTNIKSSNLIAISQCMPTALEDARFWCVLILFGVN